ncbi:MAG: hypothetical protein WDA17_05050 [Sphaerochaetaceae bacterium]
MGKNILTVVFTVVYLLTVFSCVTTNSVEKSELEVVNGKLALIEMIRSSSATASSLLAQQQKWSAFSQELLTEQSLVILNYLDEIPGIKRQLENYYLAINIFIEEVAANLPAYIENNILPNLFISDPFILIEGSEDAVTRFFASQSSPLFEKWIREQFQLAKGNEALNAYKRVEQTFNTYIKSESVIWAKENPKEITGDIIYPVTVSLLRQFIRDMSEQEALLRALAPASESSWSSLFVPY